MTQESAVTSGPNHTDNSVNKLALLALVAAAVWAYWPTVLGLADTWNREPDYSHGYLVIPLFCLFLYLRRDTFPEFIEPAWSGLLLILASVALRVVGGVIFITPFDGWSIVFWVAGAAMCLGGWPLLRWALTPTLFLFFMMPLPFRYETLISQPLQRIAALLSSFTLRCLGQPAFADNTTLIVGTEVLEVERTCSGLRIFVGIFALTCAYLIAFRRELWEASLLLLCAIPVALVANASRIVVTALLFRHATDEAAKEFSHDFAGYLMIVFAACLLWGVQWYLNCLMRDVNRGEVSDFMRKSDPVAT